MAFVVIVVSDVVVVVIVVGVLVVVVIFVVVVVVVVVVFVVVVVVNIVVVLVVASFLAIIGISTKKYLKSFQCFTIIVPLYKHDFGKTRLKILIIVTSIKYNSDIYLEIKVIEGYRYKGQKKLKKCPPHRGQIIFFFEKCL